MKVAQNDETNPDTQPVRPPRTPNISNSQLSPSGSPAWKRETPGILSRMFSPFTSITYYRVRSPLAPRIAMLYFDCTVVYCVPPPLLLSGRPRDDADAPVVDYVTDDPSLSEQPGKPPFDHQISPTLLYTACIRVV